MPRGRPAERPGTATARRRASGALPPVEPETYVRDELGATLREMVEISAPWRTIDWARFEELERRMDFIVGL